MTLTYVHDPFRYRTGRTFKTWAPQMFRTVAESPVPVDIEVWTDPAAGRFRVTFFWKSTLQADHTEEQSFWVDELDLDASWKLMAVRLKMSGAPAPEPEW